MTYLTIDSEVPDAADQGWGEQRFRPTVYDVVRGGVRHATHLQWLTHVQETGALRERRGHSAVVKVGRTGEEGGSGDIRVVGSLLGRGLLVVEVAAAAQVQDHFYLLWEGCQELPQAALFCCIIKYNIGNHILNM